MFLLLNSGNKPIILLVSFSYKYSKTLLYTNYVLVNTADAHAPRLQKAQSDEDGY